MSAFAESCCLTKPRCLATYAQREVNGTRPATRLTKYGTPAEAALGGEGGIRTTHSRRRRRGFLTPPVTPSRDSSFSSYARAILVHLTGLSDCIGPPPMHRARNLPLYKQQRSLLLVLQLSDEQWQLA